MLFQNIEECAIAFYLNRKYPFFKVYSLVTGKLIRGVNYYDHIPTGWKIAFGEEMANEIKKYLKEEGLINAFKVDQIKEKFGELRLYFHLESGTMEDFRNLEKIIDKYTEKSRTVCIHCGKPATKKTKGWISFLCGECYQRRLK